MNTLSDGEREIMAELERDFQPSAAELREIEYEALVEAHDAALDRLDALTEQRNVLLGALLEMLRCYETGHGANPEIKRARAAVALVLGEDVDTGKALVNVGEKGLRR